MAPHSALTVPDILHEVFKNLATRPQLSLPSADLGSFEFPSAAKDKDDFQTSMANRQTLACAARTCKAFAEPASCVLWEVLDDLVPIESLLRDARVYEREGKARIWERVKQVMSRVRALSCWVHGKRGDDDALSPICSRYDGHPIFPKLRVLSVGRSVDMGPWLSFLRVACASPTLVLFTITTESHFTAPKILATVAETNQQLIHLKAEFLWHFDEEGYRALAKFRNLRAAHFMIIDSTLFRHLATLPNLRTLHGQFTVSNPIIDIRDGAFPALQELTTTDMDDRTDFRAVLPLITSKSLAYLSLLVSVPLTEDMVRYIDELCSSPATAQLRKLDLHVSIKFTDQFEHEDEDVSFGFDVLTPLKRLPALTDISAVVSLRSATVATLDMNDRDMAAVASAWPDLARAGFRLTIEHNNFLDDEPWGVDVGRPPLSAVVSLGERCRKLESLDIEFEHVSGRELAQLEKRADASAACASPQTALRRIVKVNPYTDFCQKLRVEDHQQKWKNILRACRYCLKSGYFYTFADDPPRLAAALRKFFPNLRGGLEILRGGSGGRPVVYRDWDPSNMGTDAFRLLKALDDL
ncbi:hypothetical protein V8D89_015976 [Ganoderma adspersum]